MPVATVGTIKRWIHSMWRRVKFRTKAAASAAEEDRIWQDECDRLLWRLNQSAFTDERAKGAMEKGAEPEE
jgi:hypothetical protein